MSNMEPSAPDAETLRPSCPYPLTSGQFPEPSHSENHILLSGSQEDDATGLNNVDVPIGFSPYLTANRQMPTTLPIGFQNLDVRTDLVPTMPPPAYEHLFAPSGANAPKTVAAGTCRDTSPNSQQAGPSSTRRTIILGERVGNANDEETSKTSRIIVGVIVFVIVLISINMIVSFASRRRYAQN